MLGGRLHAPQDFDSSHPFMSAHNQAQQLSSRFVSFYQIVCLSVCVHGAVLAKFVLKGYIVARPGHPLAARSSLGARRSAHNRPSIACGPKATRAIGAPCASTRRLAFTFRPYA